MCPLETNAPPPSPTMLVVDMRTLDVCEEAHVDAGLHCRPQLRSVGQRSCSSEAIPQYGSRLERPRTSIGQAHLQEPAVHMRVMDLDPCSGHSTPRSTHPSWSTIKRPVHNHTGPVAHNDLALSSATRDAARSLPRLSVLLRLVNPCLTVNQYRHGHQIEQIGAGLPISAGHVGSRYRASHRRLLQHRPLLAVRNGASEIVP